MNKTDILYQSIVDDEAEKFLFKSIDEFSHFSEYGTIQKTVDQKKVIVGFWHHKFGDNLHHIVFQAERKVFLFLHRKYSSGVKLENGKISKLNSTEIGNYD